MSETELLEAASRITFVHNQLMREAERQAFNRGVDKAQEIVAEWISNGRNETALFDRLSDLKIYCK